MAAKKKASPTTPSQAQTDPAVVAFMDELAHARKDDIEAVRQLILGVSPEIREGIRWNSPSFRTREFFATLNLRKDQVCLVPHTGAKVKETATKGLAVADPSGLLKWFAKDRATVTFADDLVAKRDALAAILREWVRWV